jgi:hypothetical protein
MRSRFLSFNRRLDAAMDFRDRHRARIGAAVVCRLAGFRAVVAISRVANASTRAAIHAVRVDHRSRLQRSARDREHDSQSAGVGLRELRDHRRRRRFDRRTQQNRDGKFGADERVRLLTVPNGGKARRSTPGCDMRAASDRRTRRRHDLRRETFGALRARFCDDKLGADRRECKVGNRVNLVTRWQALEYITSQNMENRRAFASLNA